MAFSEERETLWVLAAGPFIWLAHFMASYIFAAVWCEKVAGRDGSLMPARLTIGAFTLFALLGLFYLGLRGWQKTRGDSAPYDRDTPRDRHVFLGHMTLLLSVLSAVAVVYGAMVAVFIGSCR